MCISVVLSIVTNEQLLISIIAGAFAVISCIVGIVLNVIKIIGSHKEKNKSVRVFIILVCLALLSYILPETIKNYNIYTNYQYVEGKIIDFCITPKREEGVSFKYTINGKEFTNCNAYFPYPKDSLKPNMKCTVRVSLSEPEDGRIILETQH
ncbi:MAG: hypothetical protein Fur0023_21180 [Bacteroidia bacterium]